METLGMAVYSKIINYSPFVWAISMIMYVNDLEPYHNYEKCQDHGKDSK